MVKKLMKWCSTSLLIREMQIKTHNYHCTPIRMATTKNITKNPKQKRNYIKITNFSKDVEILVAYILLIAVWNDSTTEENSWALSQRVKYRITIWPSYISLLGIYQKEL